MRENSSDTRFWSGVPESAQRASASSANTALAVAHALSLMVWASSSTMRCHVTACNVDLLPVVIFSNRSLLHSLRQYRHFCTSKASKLSTSTCWASGIFSNRSCGSCVSIYTCLLVKQVHRAPSPPSSRRANHPRTASESVFVLFYS